MLTFYLLLACPRCDTDIHFGPCVTLLEHDGLPVVPTDMAGQTAADCPECGARTYIGDLDYFCEGG